ncbi:hypothetical protein GOP47_0016249 [Adiantum capillus-veneris]|uniref:Cystathionine gamma-lyase n=1 Tax=Adiantum capillus-veneris TaxID=13818 RepID=A0A9D4UI62_ADICA|nr:hypothetical protein GOP47_0016249 [Adiantum capillus-veneris]
MLFFARQAKIIQDMLTSARSLASRYDPCDGWKKPVEKPSCRLVSSQQPIEYVGPRYDYGGMEGRALLVLEGRSYHCFSSSGSRTSLPLSSAREMLRFYSLSGIQSDAYTFLGKSPVFAKPKMTGKNVFASQSAYGSEDLGISTSILNFPNTFDPYGALSTPLYQTATFKQPSATENGPYDYTRSGNPTRTVLELLLAKLEGADKAFCFNSGMAALATVTHLARAGDEIVTGDDIYGGSDRLLSQVAPRAGLIVKYSHSLMQYLY